MVLVLHVIDDSTYKEWILIFNYWLIKIIEVNRYLEASIAFAVYIQGVEGYKDCLNGSFCSIQLSFNSIAVTFNLRDSHMRKLDECNVIQYQIISPYFTIILEENTFVYHKSSCSIHISYSSLTDASVNSEFNSFTDWLHRFWKTCCEKQKTKLTLFLVWYFSGMPCWITMLNSAFPKKKRTAAVFPNCLTSRVRKIVLKY